MNCLAVLALVDRAELGSKRIGHDDEILGDCAEVFAVEFGVVEVVHNIILFPP